MESCKNATVRKLLNKVKIKLQLGTLANFVSFVVEYYYHSEILCILW